MGRLNFRDKVEKFLVEEDVQYFRSLGICTFLDIIDLICYVNGVFLGMTFKTENGQISKLQCYNLAHIRTGDLIMFVFYPDEFEEFKEYIRNLKVGMPIAKDFAEEVNSLSEKEFE